MENKNLYRIARYTKNAYIEINGLRNADGTLIDADSDEEFWYEDQYPEDIYGFIMSKTDALVNADVIDSDVFDGLMVVTLDDDYIKYLKENDYEDDFKTRHDYINAMSEETADRKLIQSRLNHSGRVGYIILNAIFRDTIRSTRTEYKVSEELQEKLTDLVKANFTGCEIYIPPYFLKPETIFEKSADIDELAENFFIDGAKTGNNKFTAQKWSSKKINLITLLIPVFIRKTVTGAVHPLYFDLYEEDAVTFLHNSILHPEGWNGEEDENEYELPQVDADIKDEIKDCIPGTETIVCPKLLLDENEVQYIM